MDPVSHRTFQITLASAVSGVSHILINAEFWQLLSSHPDLLTPLLTTQDISRISLRAHFPAENIQRGLESGDISYLDSSLTSIKEILIISTTGLAECLRDTCTLIFQMFLHLHNCPHLSATCSLSVFTSAKGRGLLTFTYSFPHQKCSLLLYRKPH